MSAPADDDSWLEDMFRVLDTAAEGPKPTKRRRSTPTVANAAIQIDPMVGGSFVSGGKIDHRSAYLGFRSLVERSMRPSLGVLRQFIGSRSRNGPTWVVCSTNGDKHHTFIIDLRLAANKVVSIMSIGVAEAWLDGDSDLSAEHSVSIIKLTHTFKQFGLTVDVKRLPNARGCMKDISANIG